MITTDALELGIDIGELDAAVVVTFPGTVASLRQMWGRAGRRGRGLAVYVAGEDALDQFFCRHPDDFLERPVEAAILDHENAQIFRPHLLCAAHEGPLSGEDAEFLGPRWEAHAEVLQSAGEFRHRTGGARPTAVPGRSDRGGARGGPNTYVPREAGGYPAAEVSLRSASPDSFAIVDVASGELLGSTEAARAHSTVHEGAIYLHLGRSYEVRELDLQRRRALVAPFDGDWYTQPKRVTDTTSSACSTAARHSGSRSASARSRSPTRCSPTSAGACPTMRPRAHRLDLPPTSFSTQALWFELDARPGAQGNASRSRFRSSRCSARSTRPSTPRSRCCR